jgi:hypothetical protein
MGTVTCLPGCCEYHKVAGVEVCWKCGKRK